MFELSLPTEARVSSITNRVERHGDDEVPAVSIGVEITAANTLLDMIDPTLREAMFKPVDGQDQLPGVEPATPVLRCNSIERVTLPTKHEGWTLAIDAGLDGDTHPMMFGGVKCDKFSVEPKQGGSIVLRMRLGTSDVDAERLGWLAMHNGGDIDITLIAPTVQEDAIDGTGAEFRADHPDATDLFLAGGDTGPDPVDSERGETGDPDSEDWPFPDAEPGSPAENFNSRRTARGRAATKKALADGLAAQAAAE